MTKNEELRRQNDRLIRCITMQQVIIDKQKKRIRELSILAVEMEMKDCTKTIAQYKIGKAQMQVLQSLKGIDLNGGFMACPIKKKGEEWYI